MWSNTSPLRTPLLNRDGGLSAPWQSWFSRQDLLHSITMAKVAAKTASYKAASESVILVDATAGNLTVSLPPAASVPNRVYCVKKIDGEVGTVTVDADASETIDGATTKVLSAQYAAVTIVSDGTAWHILGTV